MRAFAFHLVALALSAASNPAAAITSAISGEKIGNGTEVIVFGNSDSLFGRIVIPGLSIDPKTKWPFNNLETPTNQSGEILNEKFSVQTEIRIISAVNAKVEIEKRPSPIPSIINPKVLGVFVRIPGCRGFGPAIRADVEKQEISAAMATLPNFVVHAIITENNKGRPVIDKARTRSVIMNVATKMNPGDKIVLLAYIAHETITEPGLTIVYSGDGYEISGLGMRRSAQTLSEDILDKWLVPLNNKTEMGLRNACSVRNHWIFGDDIDDLRFGFAGGNVVPPQPPVVSGVPEPRSWMMMIIGFGGVGLRLRRKRSIRA